MANNDRAVDNWNYFLEKIFGNVGFNSNYDFSDKTKNADFHILYMLNRSQRMFKWDGLPDTIPTRYLELFLQIGGHVGFYEYNGKLYAFVGALGGEPDPYYMPTVYTITNPALRLSVTAKIGYDCVVMPNDSAYLGLMPLYSRYSNAMAETELSMNLAAVNTRVFNLISASDDRTKASAEKYLSDVENGKLGVIGESSFFEGLKTQPYASAGNTNTITNLIELEQYYKASWYNELGLNANYNMKRESLNSAESQLNKDALLPLVDDMLECRKRGAEKVNELFGTNISVSLASAWEDNAQEIELEHKNLSKRVEDENPEKEVVQDGTENNQ